MVATIPAGPGVATGRPEADTYGWDTAFAVTFAVANQAIVRNWSRVGDKAKKFDQQDENDPYRIVGEFAPWQLAVGGDGRNVRMRCRVLGGSYQAGTRTYDLKDTTVEIQAGMMWVPDPDQRHFVTDRDVAATVADLDATRIRESLADAFRANGMALAARSDVVAKQLGQQWRIVSGADTYYLFLTQDKYGTKFLNVYRYDKTWSTNLTVLETGGAGGEPAVDIFRIIDSPVTGGIAAAVLPELFSTWFNENIGEFNHVFASLDVSLTLDAKDTWSWIRPTSTSYAVTDRGTLDSSVFGLLTKVENRDPGDCAHQVSVFAIPGGDDAHGANAGFLIGGPTFMKNMMLAGARTVFGGADESKFRIYNDELSITNTESLFWRIAVDEKKQGALPADMATDLDGARVTPRVERALQDMLVPTYGYHVEVTAKGTSWLLTTGGADNPEYLLDLADDGRTVQVTESSRVTIAAERFEMTLDHSELVLRFTDMMYPYSSDYDVHITYTERLPLTLQDKGGRKIFWYDQDHSTKDLVVETTKTQAAITREIIETVIVGVLTLVSFGGPLLRLLRSSARVAEVSAEAGAAVVDAEAFAAAERAESAAAAADEAAAGSAAAEQIAGRGMQMKGFLSVHRWKVLGALATVAGAGMCADQGIGLIVESAAKGEWNKVPAFGDFANTVIAPYTWPDVDGYDLCSTWLAGSLQIGLKAR